MHHRTMILLAALALTAGIGVTQSATTRGAKLLGDSVRMANDADGSNWLAYGRTYAETHASPLKQIDVSNISRLGLVWSVELPDVINGATVPLEVDGIVYFTGGPSLVHAIDVRTGRLLWRFDPRTNDISTHKMRFAWGPRGIAYWNHKIYVGTNDGRLIAIDANKGTEVWSIRTVPLDDAATITGAPRVFNGKVIIGFGGAEFGPVRGYATTYDAETGRQLWRFYATPGDPAKGFENKAMEMAAKTWSGEWWKNGGGGTIWNAITYDPELNLLYLGTGNGAPWNERVRSPGAGGDNLFLASIVAVNADTGEYVWHYQAVPGDNWDYTNSMDITLATLKINGMDRKVLMQAPKDGFMYVIDRTNGKLISAEKFDYVNWASKVDLATGRPIENPGMRNTGAAMYPSSMGAHSFMPQAYSDPLKTLFIPTVRMAGVAMVGPHDPSKWRYKEGYMSIGYETDSDPAGTVPPAVPPQTEQVPDDNTTSILAWDPIAAKEKWRIRTPGIWNGGLLVTGGDLLFQGLGNGDFKAYDARDGKPLWTFNAKMGISGAPIAYEVDGRQYITVVAGWGGTGATFLGMSTADLGWQARVHSQRIVTFALDGKAQLPANLPLPRAVIPIDDPKMVIDAGSAAQGEGLFFRACASCHGGGAKAGGYTPDLRASPVTMTADAFRAVVQGGALERRGMPKYDELSNEQLEQLRMYVRKVARDTLSAGADPNRGG
jgi:quinohemoprotein ethanol dehydrogenase